MTEPFSPPEVPLGPPRASYKHGLHKSQMEERTPAYLGYRERCSAASVFVQARETETQATRGTNGRPSGREGEVEIRRGLLIYEGC